ncbi:hypothetical protein B0G76_6764 [Paraburkholderia sp. BL23I1N1]|nr:hypothetical protein B0G76_6764 [Paraburkholderia sp. BL23I1N1]
MFQRQPRFKGADKEAVVVEGGSPREQAAGRIDQAEFHSARKR